MAAKKPKKAKAKAEEVQIPVEIETIDARYDFTDPEKIGLSQEMSAQFTKVATLEEEAKASAASHKSRIKTEKAKLNEIHGKIANGFEYRQTECEVRYDWKAGRKHYHRTTDGKLVHETAITYDDRQTKLFREEQAKLKPGENIVPVSKAFDKATEENSDAFDPA